MEGHAHHASPDTICCTSGRRALSNFTQSQRRVLSRCKLSAQVERQLSAATAALLCLRLSPVTALSARATAWTPTSFSVVVLSVDSLPAALLLCSVLASAAVRREVTCRSTLATVPYGARPFPSCTVVLEHAQMHVDVSVKLRCAKSDWV